MPVEHVQTIEELQLINNSLIETMLRINKERDAETARFERVTRQMESIIRGLKSENARLFKELEPMAFLSQEE